MFSGQHSFLSLKEVRLTPLGDARRPSDEHNSCDDGKGDAHASGAAAAEEQAMGEVAKPRKGKNSGSSSKLLSKNTIPNLLPRTRGEALGASSSSFIGEDEQYRRLYTLTDGSKRGRRDDEEEVSSLVAGGGSSCGIGGGPGDRGSFSRTTSQVISGGRGEGFGHIWEEEDPEEDDEVYGGGLEYDDGRMQGHQERTPLWRIETCWNDIYSFFFEMSCGMGGECEAPPDFNFLSEKLRTLLELLLAERDQIRIEVDDEEDEEQEEQGVTGKSVLESKNGYDTVSPQVRSSGKDKNHPEHQGSSSGGDATILSSSSSRAPEESRASPSYSPALGSAFASSPSRSVRRPPLGSSFSASSLTSTVSYDRDNHDDGHPRRCKEKRWRGREGGGWICMGDSIYVYLPPCYYFLFGYSSPSLCSGGFPFGHSNIRHDSVGGGCEEDNERLSSSKGTEEEKFLWRAGDPFLHFCVWAKHNNPCGTRHIMLQFLSVLLREADFPPLLIPSQQKEVQDEEVEEEEEVFDIADRKHTPIAASTADTHSHSHNNNNLHNDNSNKHVTNELGLLDAEEGDHTAENRSKEGFAKPKEPKGRTLNQGGGSRGERKVKGGEAAMLPDRFCFSLLHISSDTFVFPLVDIIGQISISLNLDERIGADVNKTKARKNSSGGGNPNGGDEQRVSTSKDFYREKERSAFVSLLFVLAEKVKQIPALGNAFVKIISGTVEPIPSSLFSPSSSSSFIPPCTPTRTRTSRTDFTLLTALLPHLIRDSSSRCWLDDRDTYFLALSAVLSLSTCPDPCVRDMVGHEDRIITTTLKAATAAFCTLCAVATKDDRESQLKFLADVVQYWSALLLLAPQVSQQAHLEEHIERDFIRGTVLELLKCQNEGKYAAACLVLASLLREAGGSSSLVMSRIVRSILFPSNGAEGGRAAFAVFPKEGSKTDSEVGEQDQMNSRKVSSTGIVLQQQAQRMKKASECSHPSTTGGGGIRREGRRNNPSSGSGQIESCGGDSVSEGICPNISPKQPQGSSSVVPKSLFERCMVPKLGLPFPHSFSTTNKAGRGVVENGTSSSSCSSIFSHRTTEWTPCEATLVLIEAIATFFPAFFLEGAMGVSLCALSPSSSSYSCSAADVPAPITTPVVHPVSSSPWSREGLITVDSFVPVILQSKNFKKLTKQRISDDQKLSTIGPSLSASSLSTEAITAPRREDTNHSSLDGSCSTSSYTHRNQSELGEKLITGKEESLGGGGGDGGHTHHRTDHSPLGTSDPLHASRSSSFSLTESLENEEDAMDELFSLFTLVIRNEIMTAFLFIESNFPPDVLRRHRRGFLSCISGFRDYSEEQAEEEEEEDASEVSRIFSKDENDVCRRDCMSQPKLQRSTGTHGSNNNHNNNDSAPHPSPSPSPLQRSQSGNGKRGNARETKGGWEWFDISIANSPLIVKLSQLLCDYSSLPPSVCVLVSSTITTLCLLPDPRVIFTLLDKKRGCIKIALQRVCRELNTHMINDLLKLSMAPQGSTGGIAAGTMSTSSTFSKKSLSAGNYKTTENNLSHITKNIFKRFWPGGVKAETEPQPQKIRNYINIFQFYYQPLYYLYECGLSDDVKKNTRTIPGLNKNRNDGVVTWFFWGGGKPSPLSGKKNTENLSGDARELNSSAYYADFFTVWSQRASTNNNSEDAFSGSSFSSPSPAKTAVSLILGTRGNNNETSRGCGTSVIPSERPGYISSHDYETLKEHQNIFESLSCLERLRYELDECIRLVCLSGELLQLQC